MFTIKLQQALKTGIMYIERKEAAVNTESSMHGGYARIGRVTFSKTMRSKHYGGKTFLKTGSGYKFNHIEVETGDRYWISGCRKDGGDRLYGERVPIHIDEDVRVEYWTAIRGLPGCVDIGIRYDRK